MIVDGGTTMSWIVDVVQVLVGTGIVGAVFSWGISVVKNYLNLGPATTETFEMWRDKIVQYVMDEIEEAGADWEVPETRWKYVNMAVESFVGFMPKIMDAMGYSKDDLVKEVDRYVRRLLRENVKNPSEGK